MKKTFTDLEAMLVYLESELAPEIQEAYVEFMLSKDSDARFELYNRVFELIDTGLNGEGASKVVNAIAAELVARRATPAMPESALTSDNPDIHTDMEVPPDATVEVSMTSVQKAAEVAAKLDKKWGR